MPPTNPLLFATLPPPVMEARRWLEGVEFPPERPLINLSQAAPIEPPPEALREAMAEMVRRRGRHPPLRPGARPAGAALGDRLALGRGLRRRHPARGRGGDRRLQPGLLRRGRHAGGAGRRGDAAGAVVLQPQDVARYGRHRDRGGPLRRRHAARPRGGAGAPQPAGQGDRARHPQQPHRGGIRARGGRGLRAAGAGARRGADPRRDLPRLPLAASAAAHALRGPRLARHGGAPLFVLQGVPADRPPGRRDDRRARAAGGGGEVPRHRHHLPAAARAEGGALGPAQPRRLAGGRAGGDPAPARGGDGGARRPARLAAARLRRLLRLRRAPARASAPTPWRGRWCARSRC